MSEQGNLFYLHLRPTPAKSALGRLGFTTAILGSNEGWTAFVPVDAGPVAWEEQLGTLEADLVELWFDEDSSLQLRWRRYGCSEDRFELSFDARYEKAEAEEAFLGFAGPLSEGQVRSVRRLLGLPTQKRDLKLRAHELERLVGLPVVGIPPPGASLDTLRRIWPKLSVVSRELDSRGYPRSGSKHPAGKSVSTMHVPRGRIFHLRRGIETAREGLARLKTPFAILGSNRSWTSFFPLEAGFTVREAKDDIVLRCDVLEINFDEDSGVQFRLHQAGASHGGEIQVAWSRSFDERGAQRVFFGIVGRTYLSSTKARALRDKFHGPIKERDDWLQTRGFETALGLPVFEPVPQTSPLRLYELDEYGGPSGPENKTGYDLVSADELRKWGGLREVVGPDSRKPPVPREVPSLPALTVAQKRTLDLHLFFITEVWDDGLDFQVFNRYKRHLPADRRDEVEDFLNRVMIAAPDEELRAVLAQILEGTWQSEDWDDFIRAPKLLARQSEQAQERWRKHLSLVDKSKENQLAPGRTDGDEPMKRSRRASSQRP